MADEVNPEATAGDQRGAAGSHTLTELRAAASHAAARCDWPAVIALATQVLALPDVPPETAQELLDRRATAYRYAANLSAELADLEQMAILVGKMGDAMQQIGCFLMPSIGYLNLVAGQLASGTPDPVSGAVFYGNEPAAIGRSLLVADISALQTAADSTYKADHYVLGLGPAAVTVEIVGRDPLETYRDIEKERKLTKFRQDYEIELSVAGMKWAPSSTTANPTEAQIATAANWDENLDDHRQSPLVMGICQTA